MTVGIDAKLTLDSNNVYQMTIGPDGDIVTEDAFDTAMIVSLLTDKRADESEVPVPEYRRGWVGNEATPGIEMGSKLWLYYQSRVTPSIRLVLSDEAVSALEWMIADTYAEDFSAITTIDTQGRARLEVVAVRPNSRVSKRYFDLWNNTGE